jgi:hypothetical protein
MRITASSLDYIDLKSRDRKQDAHVSQIARLPITHLIKRRGRDVIAGGYVF